MDAATAVDPRVASPAAPWDLAPMWKRDRTGPAAPPVGQTPAPEAGRRDGAAFLLRRLGRVAAFCLVGFLALSVLLVTLYRDVPPPLTPLMLLRLAQGYGMARSWRPLEEISPALIRAVIAGEDQKFCQHRGFDWDAIETAWERYESGRGRLLGASTISMQTAKNVFLWPSRDWLRKGLEAYFTALIELAWGKKRIIETYLNVVEWGPGIYGVEAAARHYFHKPALRLSLAEAARLAAVLPDPLDRSASRPDRDVLARSAFIMRQLPELPTSRPLPCGDKL
jgi:monofunctional biosynthetic peptidoglycan transglycosylase